MITSSNLAEDDYTHRQQVTQNISYSDCARKAMLSVMISPSKCQRFTGGLRFPSTSSFKRVNGWLRGRQRVNYDQGRVIKDKAAARNVAHLVTYKLSLSQKYIMNC